MNDTEVLSALKEWLQDAHDAGEITFKNYCKKLNLPPDSEYTSAWQGVLRRITELEQQ